VAQPISTDQPTAVPTASVSRTVWLAIRETVTGRRYRATEALLTRPAQARPTAPAITNSHRPGLQHADEGPGE
jgi:hypothetical protein